MEVPISFKDDTCIIYGWFSCHSDNLKDMNADQASLDGAEGFNDLRFDSDQSASSLSQSKGLIPTVDGSYTKQKNSGNRKPSNVIKGKVAGSRLEYELVESSDPKYT